jgi:hemoglobin/transferrin/lactoferrin receptor protein
MSGWSLRGSASWSRGEDRTTGTPLSSVDPPRATLGIGYDRETWGVELAGRFAGRDDDVATEGEFETPGYGVLDLLGHWAFARGAEVDAGVFNLADRQYWDAGDVPSGVLATSVVLDRYTSPGRNLGVSVSFNW